ncbi:MAG TPA: YIP1 family protein [Gaiellaceae bacterium]
MTEAAVSSPQRDWWLRAVLVLQAPRAVFSALRDESDEDELSARQEPALAIAILAGIAAVLASAAAGRLMDDPAYDGVLIAVWAFLGGALYGAFVYWAGGLLLHFGLVALGSQGSYRRDRHVLAFACVPVALSLLVWLPRLALYGEDVFRTGGRDHGAGAAIFAWLGVGFVAWAAALLAVGIRTIEGWPWGKALGALAIAAALPALVALASAGVF